MEQNIKQHTLTFEKGVCNLSPDFVCGDDELQDCAGLTVSNSILTPIQSPKYLGQYSSMQLLKVHELGSQNNYIYYTMSSEKPVDTNVYDASDGKVTSSDVIYIYAWMLNDSQLKVYASEPVEENLEITIFLKCNPEVQTLFTSLPIITRLLIGEQEKTESLEKGYYTSVESGWAGELGVSNNYVFVPSAYTSSSSQSKPTTDTSEDTTDKYNALSYCKDNSLSSATHIASFSSKILGIEIIGKIIVVNTENGINYLLWKGSKYIYLSNGFPELKISTSLYSHASYWVQSVIENASALYSKYLEYDNYDGLQLEGLDQVSSFNDAVMGLYAENVDLAAKNKGGFTKPFLLCAAIELYDGTYTSISQPILMIPSLKKNTCFQFNINNQGRLYAYTNYSTLYVGANTIDFVNYKDVIRGIAVFITPQIDIYKTEIAGKEQLDMHAGSNGSVSFLGYKDGTAKVADGISPNYFNYTSKDVNEATSLGPLVGMFASGGVFTDILDNRDESDILNDISTSSAFFKLGLIELGEDYLKTDKKTLLNITTSEQLNKVDYYSHSKLYSNVMFSVNRRLMLGGIKRSFFRGFKDFMCYRATGSSVYGCKAEVTINSSSGDVKVIYEYNTSNIPYSDMWFYYPDPRATHVVLTCNGTTILDNDLVEHKSLNGAYYLGTKLPDGTESSSITTSSVTEKATIPDPEVFNNYVLQSDVDNAFLFDASSYMEVGKGIVSGLGALTTALSSDAYKVSTIIAFTTQGIWALVDNDSDGKTDSIQPPFSREVCINPDSITMVDNGVFFISRKGLMKIDDNGIRCLSQNLNGKSTAYNFMKFLWDDDVKKGCEIAYDYRDNLLCLINPLYDYIWIYNITSSTFTRANTDSRLFNVVSFYPDTLIQDMDYNLYSLMSKPNINSDTNIYSCSLTTRPVKFDGSLILDSIRQLKHLVSPDIHICNDNYTYEQLQSDLGLSNPPALILTIYGSNDLSKWTAISSLKGKPYKFFKFHYDFKNLTATSTFAGTSFIVQQRYTEKML